MSPQQPGGREPAEDTSPAQAGILCLRHPWLSPFLSASCFFFLNVKTSLGCKEVLYSNRRLSLCASQLDFHKIVISLS